MGLSAILVQWHDLRTCCKLPLVLHLLAVLRIVMCKAGLLTDHQGCGRPRPLLLLLHDACHAMGPRSGPDNLAESSDFKKRHPVEILPIRNILHHSVYRSMGFPSERFQAKDMSACFCGSHSMTRRKRWCEASMSSKDMMRWPSWTEYNRIACWRAVNHLKRSSSFVQRAVLMASCCSSPLSLMSNITAGYLTMMSASGFLEPDHITKVSSVTCG